MAISIYSTAALVATVQYLKEPGSFLLDMFFRNVVQSQTELVGVDVWTGKRRLAPFVNPLVEGKFVEPIGFQNATYKPPYVKPKTRLDPTVPIRRSIGEPIGAGNKTPAEREEQNLVMQQKDQIAQITRRMEWMAASALANGSLTVQGESVPVATLNFGRDASLSVALTGANRWGQTGVSPAQNIDDWSARVLQVGGFQVTDVMFTPLAWRYFRADPLVAQIIASLNNGQPNLLAAGTPAVPGGQFMGNWGSYRLWRYFEWFIDPVSGTELPMITDGTVILGNAESEECTGTRAFAQIIDPEIGYPAIPFAPKSWTTQDPGARWLMTQSAPLVIPSYVNTTFAATVN